jgi:mevalonate kinase
MNFYAPGKLLLFGEYLVLKGSGCLAIPLDYGQKLQVESSKNDFFEWTSNYNDATWFSCIFSKTLEIIKETNPYLFEKGLNFYTEMNFQPEWGFGSI